MWCSNRVCNGQNSCSCCAVGKVPWGRMSPQPGEQDHQASPTAPFGVTPRREGETHRPPNHLRRQSLAQGLRQEGANRLEQIGSQLGINQPCKVHMKVSQAVYLSQSDPASASCSCSCIQGSWPHAQKLQLLPASHSSKQNLLLTCWLHIACLVVVIPEEEEEVYHLQATN